MELLTNEDCKEIIRILSKKLTVRPRIVVERLLNEIDRKDMLNGDLPVESLECHIKVWLKNGMPDYAHGKITTLEEEQKHKYYDK